jgi:hypothetical protein
VCESRSERITFGLSASSNSNRFIKTIMAWQSSSKPVPNPASSFR